MLTLNYTMSDNFFIAVGVATNGQTDSQNQPITEGFDDYGIYLHQFLLGWKASENLTIIAGKLFAPFYDNEDALVDFGDITPVGLTEKLNFQITPKLNIAANSRPKCGNTARGTWTRTSTPCQARKSPARRSKPTTTRTRRRT